MPDWSFDEFGPEFDEHAAAHLPHYRLAHDVVAHAAAFALRPGGTVADYGASTGAAIETLYESLGRRPFDAILYDVDRSMLDCARERLAGREGLSCRFVETDLIGLLPESLDVDVSLLLWTLQFLPPSEWHELLLSIRDRAATDGLLLVAAKTRLSDSRWQEQADAATAEWKAVHGVTADEALDKARSLRGTMLVVPLGRLYSELDRSGWCEPAVLFRWYSWVVVGAWATPLAER